MLLILGSLNWVSFRQYLRNISRTSLKAVVNNTLLTNYAENVIKNYGIVIDTNKCNEAYNRQEGTRSNYYRQNNIFFYA